MAKIAKNAETAKSRAAERLANGENVVRLWRYQDAYCVADSDEAERLARATNANDFRVWNFPSMELENVVPKLVRAEICVYIF